MKRINRLSNICKYVFHLDHLFVVLLAIFQVIVLWFFVLNISFLNPISRAINEFVPSDFVYEVLQNDFSKDTCQQITLVDMTELCRREDIANVITELDMCEPICLGVDLIFEGEKDDSVANLQLMSALSNTSSPLVLSKKLINYDSDNDCFLGEIRSFFPAINLHEGFTNLDCNLTNECVRNLEVFEKNKNQDTILSFSGAIASLSGATASLPNQKVHDRSHLINYQNTYFPIISYDQIGSNYNMINGHIVILGALQEEQDKHNTPIGKMSGMEIQAYSTLTILEQSESNTIPKWAKWLIAIILSYLFELFLTLVHLLLKKNTNPIGSFFNTSNVTDLFLLFLFSAIFCWFTLILLIEYHIDLDGGVVLAIVALVPESRNLYGSLISSIRSSTKGTKIVEHSIY